MDIDLNNIDVKMILSSFFLRNRVAKTRSLTHELTKMFTVAHACEHFSTNHAKCDVYIHIE